MFQRLAIITIIAFAHSAQADTVRYQAQVKAHSEVTCPSGHTAIYPEFINLFPPTELTQDMTATDVSAQDFFKTLCPRMFARNLLIHASCVKTETLGLEPSLQVVDFMHPSAIVYAAALVRRNDQTQRVDYLGRTCEIVGP